MQFYLTSLRGKEYFAKLTNSQELEPEPGVFGSLEPEPLEKKPGAGAGAGAAWEKNQQPDIISFNHCLFNVVLYTH